MSSSHRPSARRPAAGRPSGPAGPSRPTPDRSRLAGPGPKPAEMAWVLRVMLLGAATALAAGFVGLGQEHAIAQGYRRDLAAGRQIGITADQIDSTAHHAAVAGLIQAAVVAAVWVGLGLMLQRRHIPARWLTSFLCVANVVIEMLFVIASVQLGSTGSSPAVSVALQSTNAACALVTLVLLWRSPVRAWFAPVRPVRPAQRRAHPVRTPKRRAHPVRTAGRRTDRRADRSSRDESNQAGGRPGG